MHWWAEGYSPILFNTGGYMMIFSICPVAHIMDWACCARDLSKVIPRNCRAI